MWYDRNSGSGCFGYLLLAVYILASVITGITNGWREGLELFLGVPAIIILYYLGHLLIGVVIVLIMLPYYIIMYGLSVGLGRFWELVKKVVHRLRGDSSAQRMTERDFGSPKSPCASIITHCASKVKGFFEKILTLRVFGAMLLSKEVRNMERRIKMIRKSAHMTQTEFGEKIGVKGNTITGYENGLRSPSDAVVKAICREFNINETWLRTGEGEMHQPVTRDQAITDFMADILKGEPDFRAKLVSVLAHLTEDEWQMLERRARELMAELAPPPAQADEPNGEKIDEEGKDIHADLSTVL